MNKLNVYEFAGIIAPGALTIFGLSRIFPDIGVLVKDEKISFGEFGLLLILAYVAGHLVQALGNLIEIAWWGLWKGMPSDWPRSRSHDLLAPQQTQALQAKVRENLKIECPNDLNTLDQKHWFSITRQIYAAVKKAGQAERIDIFNANYGMFRGIAASLVVVIIAAAFEVGKRIFPLSLGLVIAAGLALFRMHRFGVHYARELFVQFLNVRLEETEAPKKEETE